ncbi:TPA: helix-turn-helix transcriptional regulator [Escherichia coli]
MNINDAARLASLHQIFDEPITAQQKDIILMYAMGITTETIADIKKISTSTVRKHLDSVRLTFDSGTLSSIKSIILIRLIAMTIRPVNGKY